MQRVFWWDAAGVTRPQAARLTHSSAETGFARKCKIAPEDISIAFTKLSNGSLQITERAVFLICEVILVPVIIAS